MTIDRARLYDALDQDASSGIVTRIYAGLRNHTNVWALHEALGAAPLVTGWSITRSEGGFREGDHWTTEPGLVIEFVNSGSSLEASDAFVEAVAQWAYKSGEKELLIVATNNDQFVTTLDLRALLEDALVGA